MNDTKPKKTVRRSVALGLGVACILLVAGLGGAMAYYVSMHHHTDSDYDSLTSQNTNLQNQINQLQTWLDGNETLLDQTQTWLAGNTTYYNSQIANLSNQNNQLQTWLNGNITSYTSQISSLQSNNSQLQSNYTSLQSQYNSLQYHYNLSQTEIASLQSQLLNATALITQLQGPTGILPTYMDLGYVGPYPSGGAYFLQLSLKNTGTVPITQIFVTLDSVQITMTFTYLNTTVSADAPLPSYQTTTGSQNVTPPISGSGTYPLIIQALATNGTIYTYQTTITGHA